MKKEIGAAGLIFLIGFLGTCYALITLLRKGEKPPLITTEEYYEQTAIAAETGGKEAVDVVREEVLGVIGEFATENFEWEHNKMLAAIANQNYSACVLAYKGSHVIPNAGWDKEPYEFCSNALVNYKSYVSPTVIEIIEQGGSLVETPESARTRPAGITTTAQYRWIIANTECTNMDCEHYRDYEIGYQDARINGYSESHTLFYDKVMEFAGKKTVGFFSGVFTTMKRGEWIW